MKITISIFFILLLSYNEIFASTWDEFCSDKTLTIYSPSTYNNLSLPGKITDSKLILGNEIFYHNGAIEVSLLANDQIIEIAADEFVSPATFTIESKVIKRKEVKNWKLSIIDANFQEIDYIAGKGRYPKKLIWMNSVNKKIIPDRTYYYKFLIETENFKLSTAPKAFLILSVSTIRHTIPASDFSSYESIMHNKETLNFIERVSRQMKKSPDEKLNLVTYATKKHPDICRNLFRLRNYLLLKTEANPKRFHIFCDYLKTSTSNRKDKIIITGTKAVKKIPLTPYKVPGIDKLVINDNMASINENSLFVLLKNKQDTATDKLTYQSKNAYYLELPLKPSYFLDLVPGENVIGKQKIYLREPGNFIYCGNILRPKHSLNFSMGPYFISDKLTPGSPHIMMFSFLSESQIKLSLLEKLNLQTNNFLLSFRLSGIPANLAGSETSAQKLFYSILAAGYRFPLKHLTLDISLAYYYYYSSNNVYKGREVNQTLHYPAYIFKFAPNKRIFFKLKWHYEMTLIPFLQANLSRFAMLNRLGLSYPITWQHNVFVEYLKNFSKYRNKARDENIIENLDSIQLGYKRIF